MRIVDKKYLWIWNEKNLSLRYHVTFLNQSLVLFTKAIQQSFLSPTCPILLGVGAELSSPSTIPIFVLTWSLMTWINPNPVSTRCRFCTPPIPVGALSGNKGWLVCPGADVLVLGSQLWEPGCVPPPRQTRTAKYNSSSSHTQAKCGIFALRKSIQGLWFRLYRQN